MLGQFHEQLDNLAKQLSEREAALAEAESKLREEQSRLQKEKTAWAAEHGREQEVRAKLDETVKLLAERESLLKDREEQLRIFATRNQELREQLARLGAARDEVQARLKEAVERGEIQTRRAAGLEKQVAVLQAAASPELRRASEPPVAPEPGGASAASSAPEAVGLSKRSVILSAAAVIVSASLGIWAYASYAPLVRVSAYVKVSPGDAGTLSACADYAHSNGLLVTEPDVPRGLLVFWLESRDRKDAVEKVNRAGRHMAAMFRTSTSAPASQPASTRERDEISRQIARIAQRLAATSRPWSERSDEGTRLVALWTTAETQRREVDTALASLSSATAGSAADPASIQIAPGEIQAAENADTKLRSEIEALGQREAELADTLKQVTTGAEAALKLLDQVVAEGTARIDRAAQEDYGTKIKAALAGLKQVLVVWKHASAVMSSDWSAQRDALASGADLLVCQTELDRAGQRFIETGSGSIIEFRQRLEGISQDTDEPTKGLVLGRALNKDLQPVVDAQQEVVRLARSATLIGNIELARMVQQISALRKQVADKRSQIEAALRSKILDDLKKDRERTIRERRERLIRRGEDLDREIRGHIESVRALLRRTDQGQSGSSEWSEVRELAAELRQLAETERQKPSADVSAVTAVPLEFVEASVESRESPRQRTVRSLLVAFGSLLICLVGWLGVHSYQSWHRNREAIEACARELRSVTRK